MHPDRHATAYDGDALDIAAESVEPRIDGEEAVQRQRGVDLGSKTRAEERREAEHPDVHLRNLGHDLWPFGAGPECEADMRHGGRREWPG